MMEQPLATLARSSEMNATVDLRLGHGVTLNATARATPAGLLAIGGLVSAILLSTAVLVRVAKWPPRD
ncbi:hypothetical protein [Roseomonas marmotae]|uniref:Uncharacterized protein n=1 Tax=Roseomonas marmotae TaxID=2768161 RepID=A0ABS3KC57_9PROT|nr:hypothetical protein [Roseomonas marmotae]MBO1075056.1 hypothetical protein [Roseomonas marmotae]QTI79913.1 hypothetical protein IAI58_03770 [Roseomonas marmotae]